MGIDRGVAVSAALSTGELLHCPALTGRERIRLRRLQRALARAARGSNRRGRVRHAVARLRARETDRRKDWAEKVSNNIARRFDVIRVEDLKIGNMTLFRERNAGEPGPECPAESRAEPGDPGFGVGAAGAPAGGEGAGPGGEGQTRVDEPAVLGVRAGGPGLAREPGMSGGCRGGVKMCGGWPVSRGWGSLPCRGAAGGRVSRLRAGAGAVARWGWPSADVALTWRSRPRARA